MKRLLTYGAICGLATLTATSMFHISGGIDLLMTSSVVQDALRTVLIVVLVTTLFVDEHPRTGLFPALFATISALLTVYSIGGVYEYSLQILDALVYMLAAAVLMSEALNKENRVEPTRASQPTI